MEYTIFPVKTNLLTESSTLGHVEVPYERLHELFKEPLAGDGKDSDAEWNIMLMNGHPIAIRNYRNGRAYNGRAGLPTEEINSWEVRGHYDYDFDTVREFLEGKTILDLNVHMQGKSREDLVKRLRSIADHIEDGMNATEKPSGYHSWSLEKKPYLSTEVEISS